jgi:hypothetical protein
MLLAQQGAVLSYWLQLGTCRTHVCQCFNAPCTASLFVSLHGHCDNQTLRPSHVSVVLL